MDGIEVVLVDDASDEPCTPVAEKFYNNGLDVSVIASQERLYTKNARLLGVEHAKGEIIAFADADDMLWGKGNLERNIALFRQARADILHFRCVLLDENGDYAGMNHNLPLAERLVGPAIFQAYLRGSMYGIWAHLFSRQRWLEIIPDARAFPIQHQLEDLCLLLFYYRHATCYVGSPHIGYGYAMEPVKHRSFVPVAEKTLACHTILQHFPAYLRRLNDDPALIQEFTTRLTNALKLYAGRASLAYGQEHLALDGFSDEEVATLLALVAESLKDNGRKLSEIRRSIFSSSPKDTV